MRSLVSAACIATEQMGQAFGGKWGLGCCSMQPMTAPNDLCGYDLDQKVGIVRLARSPLGSKADKPSRVKKPRCPLWSKSGQTQVRLDCPLSARSGHAQ